MSEQRQNIIITGASSGIGAAAAKLLAAGGANVLLVARREAELSALADEIIQDGGQADIFVADLSEAEATERCADEILANHPQIDVLINNAGRSIRRSVMDSSERPHDYERTMALNFHAAVRLSLRVLPGMRARNRGHIINVSSQSTQMPMPRYSAYMASKSALEAFSRSLAAEQAGSGIDVTVINYPLVRTAMSSATKLYDKVPMLTPDEAALWLLKAVEKRPARVASLPGKAWEISTAAAPGMTTQFTGRMMNYLAKRMAKNTA